MKRITKLKNKIKVNNRREKIYKVIEVLGGDINSKDIDILFFLIENQVFSLKDEKDPKSVVPVIKVEVKKIKERFQYKNESNVYSTIQKLKKFGLLEVVEGKKNYFYLGEFFNKINNEKKVVLEIEIQVIS